MVSPDRARASTAGENPPEEWLDADELAEQAQRLIVDFKLALLENPFYKQAAANRHLADRARRSLQNLSFRIPFAKNGISYYATYEGYLPGVRRLCISRFPEGQPGRREDVEVECGIQGEDEVWGAIQWGSLGEPGKGPEIHTNTRTALERVEAFLQDLQGE